MLEPVRLPDPQDVAACLHWRDVGRLVGRIRDGEHDVDDRLRRQAGHGRRADVLQEPNAIAKDRSNPRRLAREQGRPGRVVRRELDRPGEHLRLADRRRSKRFLARGPYRRRAVSCHAKPLAPVRFASLPDQAEDGPGPRDSMSPAVATERSHRGLVQRFAKPPCGVTCIEGSNPSLSASPHSIACARSSADRALGCGPKGRWFESSRARHHSRSKGPRAGPFSVGAISCAPVL